MCGLFSVSDKEDVQMCKAKHSSHFFLCAFFGVLINLTGLLPAALLLALHAWRGISAW